MHCFLMQHYSSCVVLVDAMVCLLLAAVYSLLLHRHDSVRALASSIVAAVYSWREAKGAHLSSLEWHGCPSDVGAVKRVACMMHSESVCEHT